MSWVGIKVEGDSWTESDHLYCSIILFQRQWATNHSLCKLASRASLRWHQENRYHIWLFLLDGFNPLKLNWHTVCVFGSLTGRHESEMENWHRAEILVSCTPERTLLHDCLEKRPWLATLWVLPLTHFHNKTFKQSRPKRKQPGSVFHCWSG